MTAFEDFVNLELPKRRPLLQATDADVAFDGDPNDAGAPAILQGSPVGTWYFQNSANTFWRKDTASWKPERTDTASSAINSFSNIEPLAFTIDPINGNDPAPNSFFQTQAAVNEFGAFQTVQAVWDALPGFVVFDVTVQLPAGTVSMANSVDASRNAALSLGGRVLSGGRFIVQGQPTSAWTEVVAAQAVTAAVTTEDPQVTVSGTPFTGLDLRNAFAEVTDGTDTVVLPIIRNDNSTVFVTGPFQADPNVFVFFTPTSVRIIKPSTVLTTRNLAGSLMSGAVNGVFVELLSSNSTSVGTEQVLFQDIELDFDPVSATSGDNIIKIQGGLFELRRFLVDYDRIPGNRADNFLSSSGSSRTVLLNGSFSNLTGAGSSSSHVGGSNGSISIQNCSFIGISASLGLARASRGLRLTVSDCYFRECLAPVLSASSNGELSLLGRFGVANIFDNCVFQFVGLLLISSQARLDSLTGIRVDTFAGPAIDITSDVGFGFTLSTPSSARTATGLTGYFIDLDGAANVTVDADVNGTAADFPSGTAGDILLPSGETLTWEDIVTNGTYIETDGNNRIRKI